MSDSHQQEKPREPRGYFLSAEEGEQLRLIGEAIGLNLADWLADRDQTSWRRRQQWEEDCSLKLGQEKDSLYAHLRAVVENCKTMSVEAIRHQLVGLLPETQTMPPEIAARMREKGLGALAERQEQLARLGWAKYGYPEEPGDV